MKSYANLKWLSKLGTWTYDNKEITFTNMEMLFGDDNDMNLVVTISVYDGFSGTSEIIENIPVYLFSQHWTKLAEVQMIEVIVDYLNLGFENLKELGLGYQYLELIKNTEDYI